MRTEICGDRELVGADRQAVEALGALVFDEEDGLAWSDIDWHVLIWDGEILVSHVEIIERMGSAGGETVRLGGIGGVATHPAWRGRGLASLALRIAELWLREVVKADFGLLICGEARIPFYRRLGWQVVQGPLCFDQPTGKITFDDVTMVLPCLRRDWPAGAIDLCGLPW